MAMGQAPGHFRFGAAAALALALALAGCTTYDPGPEPGATAGSPAATASKTAEGPSGTSVPRPSRSSRPPKPGTPAAQAYSWGLPPSDTSVAGNDGPAYAALQRGCAKGQAYLDEVAPDGYGFRSPLNVVLYAAGLRLCFGDRAGAKALYAHGVSRYGLSGLPEGKPECELYKSVRSVLEQRPRTQFPCPGGLPPENITGPTGLSDDPLTIDVDESLPTEAPDASPTPETSQPVAPETSPDTAIPETTLVPEGPETVPVPEPATEEPATPSPTP